MLPLNAVNPSFSTQPEQLGDYAATIQNVVRKGYIKPYEAALSKSDGWSRENWLQRLQACSNGKGKPLDLIPCYLFAVAVSDDVDLQKKEELFETCYRDSDEKGLRNFYSCFAESFPPVMAAHLLRYSGLAHWEAMLKRLFKYSDMHICEKPLTNILLEAAHNNWSVDEKKAFIDLFFERLPKERADEVYFYMTLNASTKDVDSFLGSCSQATASRLRGLSDELLQYGKRCFAALDERIQPVRIDFSDYRRLAFMVWLLKQKPEHPATDCIVSDFNEKDWARLEGKVATEELAMKYVSSILGRMSRGEIIIQNDSSGHNAHIWLFICNAMKVVEGKFSRTVDVRSLAPTISPEVLAGYLNAFPEKVRKALVAELVKSDPSKLITWLIVKENEPDGYRSTASTRLEEPLRLIEKCSGIQRLFLAENDEARRVTWFAAASEESKTVMMQSLLANRDEALQVLRTWLGLCAFDSVKPFVREAIIGTLNKTICKQDPEIATVLRGICLGIEGGLADFVELVIPAELDPTDPLARSKQALGQLKRHFETRNIGHEDRKNFVYEIYADLRGPMNRDEFIEFLFASLPSTLWPLVFLYFERDVCSGFFDAYTEEKMGGLMMKRTNKHGPSDLSGTLHESRMEDYLAEQVQKHEETNGLNLQGVLTAATLVSLERAAGPSRKDAGWKDEARLVEVFATSLVHMLTTPGFTDVSQANWAMSHLYQAACETNTIHKVMSRFIEMCPPERFIPIMTEWCRSAFYHNRDGLVNLVAESLETVNINKFEFMARVIIAGHRLNQNSGGFVDFTEVFWKEPCTKTEEDRAKIVRCIIEITKDQFSSLFTSWSLTPAIKCLYATDQAFCTELYKSHMKNYRGEYKTFERFTEAFFDAGVDVFTELESDELSDVCRAAKEWLVRTRASDVVDNFFSWTLLHRLVPELTLSRAVERVDTLFAKKNPLFFYFRMLISTMHKLGLGDQFEKSLFSDEVRVQVMSSVILGNMHDVFTDSELTVSLPFIERLVPDWQERLVKWTREEMLKEQNESRSHGNSPRYYRVKSLVEYLQKANLYEAFLAELIKDGHEMFKNEIERVMKK